MAGTWNTDLPNRPSRPGRSHHKRLKEVSQKVVRKVRYRLDPLQDTAKRPGARPRRGGSIRRIRPGVMEVDTHGKHPRTGRSPRQAPCLVRTARVHLRHVSARMMAASYREYGAVTIVLR